MNNIAALQTKTPETYEDLYDTFSEGWQGKAQRLRARRWHALRREMSGVPAWPPRSTSSVRPASRIHRHRRSMNGA